jgi:hypothetical protein
MPKKAMKQEVYQGRHGKCWCFGLLLLVIGLIGFAIEYGYLNVPFWPTAFLVAGIWSLLMHKCSCCK